MGKAGGVRDRKKQTEGPSRHDRKRNRASLGAPHRHRRTQEHRPGAGGLAVAAVLPCSLSDVHQTPIFYALNPTYE